MVIEAGRVSDELNNIDIAECPLVFGALSRSGSPSGGHCAAPSFGGSHTSHCPATAGIALASSGRATATRHGACRCCRRIDHDGAPN